MRNLLLLLLIGGIVYLGYEFGRRRSGDVEAADRKKVAVKSEADATKRAASAFQPLQLDQTGMKASAGARPVGAAEAQFADSSVAAEADRYVAALDQRDFSGLQPSVDLRERFPIGSMARYALEVALAVQQGQKGSANDGVGVAELRKAATTILRGGSGGEARDRLAAGFESLTRAKRLSRAVVATGGQNDFLAGKRGGAACRAWIEASAEMDPVARAIGLSGLVDVLTRGRVPVWTGPAYELLRDTYMPLQQVLKQVVFNSRGNWKSRRHKIGKGELLSTIAKRCVREWDIPMSPGLLMRINRIPNAKLVRAGSILRIPTERIRIVVEKSSFSMKVFLGDVLLRLYEIGLGEDDSTPETEFRITELQLDPQWTNPKTGVTVPAHHPENLIGRYFIKLEDGENKGFGIHGTKDQSSIGKNSSMGCIRLRQDDIADLFDYIPRRTKVLVRN